ncbi:MAG: FUSC family protein [Pseudomonadota bacterium]
MIGQYSRMFFGEIKQSIAKFSWNTPATINALRAALACVFAVFLALWLQAEQPFWSAISSLIVMQPFVGNAIDKALHRFIGTVIGASLGLLLASLFIQQHLMMYLAIFFVAFIGIYIGSIAKKHSYSWLLGYGTALIITFQGLANPTPDNFIHIAFFRAFEVSIGIFAGVIVNYTVFPQRAMTLLKQDIVSLTQSLDQLFQDFCQYIQDSDSPRAKQAFASNIMPFRENLQRLQSLLQIGEYEHFRDPQTPSVSYDRWLKLLNHISTMMLVWYRHHDSDHKVANYLANVGDIWPSCLNQAQRCLHCLQAQLARSQDLSVVQDEIDQFEQLWRTLEQSIAELGIDNADTCYPIEEVEQVFQQLVGIRVAVFEIASFIRPDKSSRVKHHPRRKISWQQRLHYYDWYYVKHAFLGACALLCLPLVWLFFNLPGFAQIAVSIIATIGIDIESTSSKGVLRIIGCFFGLIITVLFLGLNIQNIFILLLLLYIVGSVFLYFYFANSTTIGYFGLQATIVFSVGFISQVLPVPSISPAVERMVAITLGISSIILFQHVLWHFSGKIRANHHLRQLKCALHPLIDTIERYFMTDDNTVTIDNIAYFKIRSILKTLQTSDAELFEPSRDLSQHLYFLFVLTQHSTQRHTLLKTFPALSTQFTKLADSIIYPYCYAKEIDESLSDSNKIDQDLLQDARQLWQKDLLATTSTSARFEIFAILSTLRQIISSQHQLMKKTRHSPYISL